MKVSKASTVDQFVAEAPAVAKPVLQKIRQVVKAAVPQAEEVIGYNKPFYKYHGWMTGIQLYAKHLGVEIIDGLSIEERKELEAAGYQTGSKTFRINYDQEVPVELLTKLTRAQAKRNEAKR